jgi:hypothetical protein
VNVRTRRLVFMADREKRGPLGLHGDNPRNGDILDPRMPARQVLVVERPVAGRQGFGIGREAQRVAALPDDVPTRHANEPKVSEVAGRQGFEPR